MIIIQASDLTDPGYRVQRYNEDTVPNKCQSGSSSKVNVSWTFSLANPSKVPALLCTHLRIDMIGAAQETPSDAPLWVDRLDRALSVSFD